MTEGKKQCGNSALQYELQVYNLFTCTRSNTGVYKEASGEQKCAWDKNISIFVNK